jgi:hypothetical protein
LKIDDATRQLKVSPRTVKTAKAVKEADPALAEEVRQGKTKLSTAAKIVAKKSFPRPPGSGTKKRGGEEAKRHDDRMKSARINLKRLFAIIPTWPNGRKLSRQSKHSLERNTMT